MNQPKASLVLSVPRRRLEEWLLQEGQSVALQMGAWRGEALVRRLDRTAEGERLVVDYPGGRLEWGTNGLRGQVNQIPGEGLRIGPLVGILTLGVKEDLQRPLGGRTKLLGDFVRAAHEMNVVCYVFNASEVDWTRGLVKGVTMVRASKGGLVWKRMTFPLPDVVYNRIPHRNGELSEAVVRVKQECRKREIPLFNERFVNKREMYQYLLQHEGTKPLIPNTDRMRTPDGLERFCRTHPFVYLKPIGGSLGMGILAVKRRADHYVTRYRKQGKHRTSKFREAQSLYSFVRRYNPDRIYMMQQGIHLKQHQGNPTDFRVHMHKNGDGTWQVAGIGAKIAGKGAVTTHVHNGGHVLNGEQVLLDWFAGEADAIRARIIEASIRVAQTMEGMLQGPVGEWGLDVGIDEQQRIWVFEANAKPGRAIFDHPDLQAAGRRSSRYLIEYAQHLAQFPLPREGEA